MKYPQSTWEEQTTEKTPAKRPNHHKEKKENKNIQEEQREYEQQ